MAIKTECASCGKRINANATLCPKCGGVAKVVAPLVDKKAERKGALWAYITGTLFIITGLGAFQIGMISAIMLILGGTLALPFVRAGLVKLSGFKTDKFLVIISAILIIGGVIGYTSSVKSDRLDRIESTAAASE
ncbi:MAG: zinc ribbon domain-containing protein [Psychrobacter sp.]|nr:zinc ribbon domain-containing protein [Psychrobacter sp.]